MIPFRLGTTSYIIPDDILPNVRFLCDRVQDIELVLFEVSENLRNLPSPEVVRELEALAGSRDLSFTVHLPLDLRLGSQERSQASLVKAKKVIDCTSGLNPWAYIVHLNGAGVEDRSAWVRQATQSLERMAAWAGDMQLLALENLEGYPLDFNELILKQIAVSRCIDIGHLWLDGHDPLPVLQEALPRMRVVHLHGVAERDHESVDRIPAEQLEAILELLLENGYAGVVTLEVFNLEDLESSRSAVERALSGLWAES